jgi:putative transcriptional regulator
MKAHIKARIKKINMFVDLMEGIEEATRFRAGEATTLRITEVAPPPDLKPSEIKKLRKSLKVSQPAFANYLGTSVGAVRSWEQGGRKPQKATMRLLSVVKQNPAVLLQAQGKSRSMKAGDRVTGAISV